MDRATTLWGCGYRDGKIDRGEAFIVLEIFGRFADGMSPRSIAADLNARRIPSPGASWKRSQRRADGWMGSGIRVIVRNERYRGVVHWNTSEWRKDSDTGKRKRVMRPRSEWISSVDESIRIVSGELWGRAQRRMRAEAKARELRGLEASSMPAMKAFTMLPRVAEAYRRQITLGLEGEPRAALKARSILRELFGGEIRLVPEPDGGLTAHWNLHTSALVRTLGTSGSGGALLIHIPIS